MAEKQYFRGNNRHMKHKEYYEAPAMQLIGVEQGYVVCTSGGTEPFTDGNNYGEGLFN